MSEYNPRRTRNLFDPGSDRPFSLSRSKVELFVNCPRCFYLDRRLGVAPPPGPPFNLNSAVDALLKKEFDVYRRAGKPHPLMERAGVDAIPCDRPELDDWRNNFRGVRHHHAPTHFTLSGAIDDLWIDGDGDLIVVDYKATSKSGQLGIDSPWQRAYKRQMEFYQWLLRRNACGVSATGYFIYCNGLRDRDSFNQRLEFEVAVIPYAGDDGWVEATLGAARECLEQPVPPPSSPDCEQCRYNDTVHLLFADSPD
ncbi:MAG: PD-(D/E)XK nuclease family protein [Gammaproteobacteria bacterium]|nr:PD-(D/E)XK nuclease family protein [Gammaproteobacteria bacterium]